MITDHGAKLALNEQFARVAKGLASSRRLELLDVLAQGPRSVEALAGESEMSVGLASAHLKALRAAGLVTSLRDGQRVLYRLVSDDVYALLVALRRVAHEQLADVERAATAYLGDDGGIEPITRKELWARVQAGDAVVLDLRPGVEYAAGHIPGAVSIPLDELPDRLADLPGDREIVAYCRGTYCALAPRGVQILRAAGFDARVVEAGLPEWRLAGYPVEASQHPKEEQI
jgi:rhodanese-related sulfurtransferase/DNA-binding transcriptional ArsR family regulator